MPSLEGFKLLGQLINAATTEYVTIVNHEKITGTRETGSESGGEAPTMAKARHCDGSGKRRNRSLCAWSDSYG